MQCGEESRRRSEKELEGCDFLPFPDLDLTVKDDVEYLKESKAITSNAVISGLVYEVKIEKASQVV